MITPTTFPEMCLPIYAMMDRLPAFPIGPTSGEGAMSRARSSGGLDSPLLLFFDSDIEHIPFPRALTDWIDREMTAPVGVHYHKEPLKDHPDVRDDPVLKDFVMMPDTVLMWRFFKFENERDLMTFKLFWS